MSGVIRMRVERLGDDLARTREKLDDLLAVAEEEKRELNDFEREQATKYRTQIKDLEDEIELLAVDIERENASRDVSALLRVDEDGQKDYATPRSDGPVVYRQFGEYVRDVMVLKADEVARQVAGPRADITVVRAEAQERLERAVMNTTTSYVPGLILPTYMTQIMDIISNSRPVVASGRSVPLDRGTLYYPYIERRPTVELQSSEKTAAGTVSPIVSQGSLTASTYLGAGNISWQAVNWSSPDVISLWFDLAAEAYARQTETVACDALEDEAGIGTVGTASGRLGTAGTESFGDWRKAVAAGASGIHTATGGRSSPNVLYLSANRFFQLATLGTDAVAQMSPIGNVDMGAMTGTFFGLRVIGSYAFDTDTAIVGDSGALMIGENAGNPVELRVVEPSIGGYEIGLIGAFGAGVFDANRFYHLSTHL